VTRRATFRWVSCTGIIIVLLSGCAPDGTMVLGCDGSVHPDGTAAIANYTGQGESGQGWAGNADGEGGPSAIPPLLSDLSPRGSRSCGSTSQLIALNSQPVGPPVSASNSLS
jgi:hypothetical protein